ncbi:MAG: hypothetical protein ABSC05_22210 [Candidatus Solibacter sp.]|jgi:hypothetical protein
MKMDVDHLAYIQGNPGKSFCLGCLRRLSTRIKPDEATKLVGKPFRQGTAACFSYGTVTTVYLGGGA